MLSFSHNKVESIKDRREAQRFSICTPCKIRCSEIHEAFIPAQIIDLSNKGIFIITDQSWFSNSLQHSSIVEININAMINMFGKIKHFDKDGVGISLHINDIAIISLCINDIN